MINDYYEMKDTEFISSIILSLSQQIETIEKEIYKIIGDILEADKINGYSSGMIINTMNIIRK